MKPVLKGCLFWGCILGVVVFASLLTSAVTSVTWFIDLPISLWFGWFFYLKRTISEITWNWQMIASGVGYLVISVVGFHLIARNFALFRGSKWKWKSSICISTMFLLIFGVSLAIGGIVHQAAWLAREDTWIGKRGSGGYITKQIANARQLILAVRLFAADEGGRYPARLEELLLSQSLEGLSNLEGMAFSGASDTAPAPWIYVRGLSDSAPGDLPLIIAPGTYSGGKRIIGTNDTSVELMRPSDIRKQLPKWKADYATLGIPLPPVMQEYDQAETPPAK